MLPDEGAGVSERTFFRYSIYPFAVGRAALAACRAAFDRWSVRADNDLTVYLDAALTALAAGFASEAMRA